MRRLGWPLFGAMAISVGILSSCSNPTTSSTGTVRPNTTATSLPLRNGLTPIVKSPGPVPSLYQSQYTQVRSEVSSFATQVGKAPAHPSTTIGTELLAANGNIGTRLLTPGALSGVEAELDVFRALGIDAVTVAVSFPLLLSTTPQSSQYLSFYEPVASRSGSATWSSPSKRTRSSRAPPSPRSRSATRGSLRRATRPSTAAGPADRRRPPTRLSVHPHRARHLYRHPGPSPRQPGPAVAVVREALDGSGAAPRGRGRHRHLVSPADRCGADCPDLDRLPRRPRLSLRSGCQVQPQDRRGRGYRGPHGRS